ncbi:hypothetical protein GXY_01846 [Novacetimonas hansenii ATCC 23769]|uniref:Uncharacterized protein n=1 Tax=Novacetimonas hansenii ATCC 23769 TaxID=714995 RepID=D5QB78_NOVHA|nr:hypothetical protein GXY_01846 [Novacetimonas hansenii ATCC 23769]
MNITLKCTALPSATMLSAVDLRVPCNRGYASRYGNAS